MELSGTIVFASGAAGDFDIWSLDLGTEELKQLTFGDYWNDSPKWSPDGSQIVFVSNRSGVPELWLMNSDGSEQRQLTKTGRYHLEPAWSPDGEKIIYCANYGDPDNLDIYTLNADGSRSPELIISTPVAEGGPCFAPDGKKIAFSSTRAGREDIWEYDLQSKEWTRVTSHAARDFGPAYSPDGKWIAFVTEANEYRPDDASADADIWIVTRDGKEKRQLTENSGSDRYVAWSPDGDYIVCCSSRKGASGADRLTIIDVATTEVLDFGYSRKPLEVEIGAQVKPVWLFSYLPQALTRQLYSEDYFGTERYPHWKRG